MVTESVMTLIARLFIEQPLALPGSAKYLAAAQDPNTFVFCPSKTFIWKCSYKNAFIPDSGNIDE